MIINIMYAGNSFASSHPEATRLKKNKCGSASGEEKSRGFARDGEFTSPQKEILDSIHYAKRIQTALIPSDKYIEKSLNKLQKRR